MHKISFKLLDKYNLCGIIKNVENRWIDDSSRQITRMNEYNPPNCYLGGLLLFVAYYNISDRYYTTYDADNSFNRNNYHSPL